MPDDLIVEGAPGKVCANAAVVVRWLPPLRWPMKCPMKRCRGRLVHTEISPKVPHYASRGPARDSGTD